MLDYTTLLGVSLVYQSLVVLSKYNEFYPD